MKIKFFVPLFLMLLGSFGLEAQVDLYVRDSNNDTGIEPNTVTGYNIWSSPDIWTRHAKDGGLVHQNPEYNTSGIPNVVYVRVTNRGTQPSTGYERLKTYWAKASTGLSWTQPWNGGVYLTNAQGNLVTMGEQIGTSNIPILQPGQQVIIAFPWVVPNPADYIFNPPIESWHFCLLARIVASNDPMHIAETTDLGANVRNNNNIAWKNLSIVDVVPNKKLGGAISVGVYDKSRRVYLEFAAEKTEHGKVIFEEAEIAIQLDNKLVNIWEQGGKKAQFLEERVTDNKLIVRGDNAILDNLYFEDEEVGIMDLTFNFLTEEPSELTQYIYNVIQKDAETGEVIGGETYIINRYPKDWIPEEPIESKNATVKLGTLENIAPNPSSDRVTINYKLDGVNSAYLMFTGLFGAGTSNKYILDPKNTQTTIDISSYTPGLYNVILVCDSKMVDTKSLLKK